MAAPDDSHLADDGRSALPGFGSLDSAQPGKTVIEGLSEAIGKGLRTRAVIVVAGICIGIGFVVLTARHISWQEVARAFSTARWLPWMPLAVLTYIVGMWLRGLRLQLLVRDESAISIGTASNIVAVGYAINNILPARLGELARAGMLAERTGSPYLLSLTITFVERLLDGLVILFLFVTASFMVPSTPEMRSWASIAALVFALAMVAVALIVLTPQTAIVLASNSTSSLSRSWHSRTVAFVTQINRGFSCLRSAHNAILVLSTSFLVWLTEALFFMFVMPCFGLPPGFLRAIITMSVTNLGILLPSSPGHVGTYHWICQKSLTAVCSVSGLTPGTAEPLVVDTSVAFSYAVLVHLIFYSTVTIWGLFALFRYSMELGTTQAMVWEAKPIRSLSEANQELVSVITSYPDLTGREATAVTVFWSAFCECFIPAPHVIPDRNKFQQVLLESSTFTVTELERLPLRLRVLFDIGIFGFKTITIATHGRFLCDIPLDKRRKIINAWAFGPVSLTRKFMKPIRSLFLIAYYETPEVVALLDGKSDIVTDPSSVEERVE
ncbi:MAG: flippase-like domain-containing protein [Candidatus Obscuribacterales bacterium]|nr:flippase-like domain-containing protein [Candidatus Obscuribacterales bacterium]